MKTDYGMKYAVLSGKRSVVQLLLDNGADPNLPFGIYETSVSIPRAIYILLTRT